MDSKIFCVSLLAFCLWSTEAIPLEDGKDYGTKDDITYGDVERGAMEDNTAVVNAQTARVTAQAGRAMSNQLKTTDRERMESFQLADNSQHHAKEFTRIMEEWVRMSVEEKQLAGQDFGRVGSHLATQKDWESKGRETNTMTKETEVAAQKMYTKSRELKHSSTMAYAQAYVHEAQAIGHFLKSKAFETMAKELKQIADLWLTVAKNSHEAKRNNEVQSTAERNKAHQQGQDTQKHLAAARAYQEDAIKYRINGRSNINKYIEYSLMAERSRNIGHERKLTAELESKIAAASSTISEESAAMSKNLLAEAHNYEIRARSHANKARTMKESSTKLVADVTDLAGPVGIVEAEEETADSENHIQLKKYDADDAIAVYPGEEKLSVPSSDNGWPV